ncbi:phospholipase/carboxylesterase [Neorhodopirellula lusitana]|uniref:Phospholipase/carboxylesterase n=1 Tax=Neorhodopirellula lusitana TaxID=445327 RepID=A0ABY1Q090_9BACT|nr:alpha/beta hydrolase-fold protein [Neorhodopirellula lusitana]SMP53561.1 phospholipase/carboxylesterase [Neorhodopirellula lusitana]
MSGSFSRRWSLGDSSHAEQSQDVQTVGDPPLQTPGDAASNYALGKNQGVQILTPVHYQHGYQYPLLVWLHSAGHNERQVEKVLPHISTRNYVSVGVRATKATDVRGAGFDWTNSRNGVAKASQSVFNAIELAKETFSIHPERVILAGFGSGATMACRVAMQNPESFAGVVRMAGQFPTAHGVVGDGIIENFKALRQRRMPMLWQQAINGVDDDPDQLQLDIASAQNIQAQVEIRQYRNEDVMNTAALKDIDRWCFDKIFSPQPAEESTSLNLIRGADLKRVDFSSN